MTYNQAGSRYLKWILEVVLLTIKKPVPLQSFYRKVAKKKGEGSESGYSKETN
jgi:hypothetical protein